MEQKDTKKEQPVHRSPDQFSGQIKILSPGIWILVIALVVLFAGGFLYARYGKVNLELPVCAYVEDGKAELFIRDEYFSDIKLGQKVIFNDWYGTSTLTSFSTNPVMIPGRISDEYMRYGNYHVGEIVYIFTAKTDIPNGAYYANIVTGSVHPLSLLFD